MTNVLEIKGLSKNYGKLKAVQNLNLTIQKGQVYGILGPNGSGKTTTLGMILWEMLSINICLKQEADQKSTEREG